MVRTMEVLTAVLALVAGVAAVLFVVARVLAGRSSTVRRLGVAVVGRRSSWTLAVASVATFGSLYFSEVADYVPCRLCWFQRIAMYPIALVALVATIRRDAAARWYVVPMAAIGAVVSSYHYLIERGVVNDSGSCALFGPSCADVWFEEFGFVTLAFMALVGFVAVLVVNVVSFPPVPTEESS
ncbi:MAG: disulfide bond formation protein B [Ilumatobacteraceae bacterium]